MYKYPEEEPRRVQHADVELPLMENDEVLEAPVNQRTLTMRYTGRAIEFIRDHRDEPFFLYLPHTFPHTPSYASEETATVASIANLLPTFAGFAGVVLPESRTFDGVSLVPLLSGNDQSVGERLFCCYFGAQLQAVRLGRWKLILKIVHYPALPASVWYADNRTLFERHYRLQTAAELYDLEADISESQDVSSRHPEVVQRLTALAGDFDRSLQADIR